MSARPLFRLVTIRKFECGRRKMMMSMIMCKVESVREVLLGWRPWSDLCGVSHSQVPYEIAFKPGTKMLAVAEK